MTEDRVRYLDDTDYNVFEKPACFSIVAERVYCCVPCDDPCQIAKDSLAPTFAWFHRNSADSSSGLFSSAAR